MQLDLNAQEFERMFATIKKGCMLPDSAVKIPKAGLPPSIPAIPRC
jgi:hypothetical protein